MATTYKVLGQAAPAATTYTDLYTVPAATATVSSSLIVCNQSSTATTFRVAVRKAGATLAVQHYVVYDAPLAGNQTIELAMGMSLAATDVVTVYCGAATVSITVFGAEIA